MVWIIFLEILNGAIVKIKYKANKNLYYINKEDAIEKYSLAIILLKKEIGSEKFSDLTQSQIIKKINIIDPKIPLVDFDLYYL